jgi:hypothetical protein
MIIGAAENVVLLQGLDRFVRRLNRKATVPIKRRMRNVNTAPPA